MFNQELTTHIKSKLSLLTQPQQVKVMISILEANKVHYLDMDIWFKASLLKNRLSDPGVI